MTALRQEIGPDIGDTARSLTSAQRGALKAIAFFRRQRKAGKGWLVGDARLSDRLVERLERMQLVEERFVSGAPVLQLTIIGQAVNAALPD